MELSAVIPTLNGRERLTRCLDSLAEHAPGVEVVVVNGPSTDGTTGMVRERDDVDLLVEVSDRNVNVARNAGLWRAAGDVVAFLGHDHAVAEGWAEAIRDAVSGDTTGVTGPTHRNVRGGVETDQVESRTIAGRTVTYFNRDNFALRAEALRALDGFDEALTIGGARDAAHRLAALDEGVEWVPGMNARCEFEPDGGIRPTDWTGRYHSLTYRLVKNYGPRPTVVRRVVSHAGADAMDALLDVLRAEGQPSAWFGNGRDVLTGMVRGATAGLGARLRDRTPRRNPNGLSARIDRAVDVYDCR